MQEIDREVLRSPSAFAEALRAVAPGERDEWLDGVLGIDSLVADGPELPRGCVPYLPCPVHVLLRMVELAGVQRDDVFVDVGAGVGRALAGVHLVTGAAAVGIEVQPALVATARDLVARLGLTRVSVVAGDAAGLMGEVAMGSVFLLYCPFSGERLQRVLDDLEVIARSHVIRVCCVHLPLPPCPWLQLVAPPAEDLAVYRSTLLDGTQR